MSRKLKVAYLLGTFPQLTQTFVTREIFWIGDHDVETHIFSLNKPKSIPDDKLARTLHPGVHYSPYLSWEIIKAQFYFLRRSPIRYIRALLKAVSYTFREPKMLYHAMAFFPKSVYFARRMEELGVEHIHAHFITLASISASTASILLGITFTMTTHAVDLFKRNPESVRQQIEDASGIVTIASFHHSHIAQMCPRVKPDDIGVVYCGLDTDHFQPNSKPAGDGPIRIFSVGRLMEKKGFEYLIDACALVAEAGLPFQCNIVGDGPLMEALQERIDRHGLQKQVVLLGPRNQGQVLELYQNSDIFVLACVVAGDGNRDGLPVVLIEAMACELAVITTPVTGITDLAQHGQTGLLVKERDVVGLAESIKSLIKDEKMRRRLGKQGREKVIRDFRIQNSTARLAAIFRKVAGSNGKYH